MEEEANFRLNLMFGRATMDSVESVDTVVATSTKIPHPPPINTQSIGSRGDFGNDSPVSAASAAPISSLIPDDSMSQTIEDDPDLVPSAFMELSLVGSSDVASASSLLPSDSMSQVLVDRSEISYLTNTSFNSTSNLTLAHGANPTISITPSARSNYIEGKLANIYPCDFISMDLDL